MNQSDTGLVDLLTSTPYLKIKEQFIQELNLAQQGEKSSLSFITHQIPQTPILTKGIIQGIVIGGTNFISKIIEIDDRGKHTLKAETGVLPQLTDSKQFFSFLKTQLDPRAQAIGLNFGFPLKPYTDTSNILDGILLYGTKEHTMHGMVGKPIGREVATLFLKEYGRLIPVSTANDTVCLTLSGKGNENGSIVIGTGFNMAIKLTGNNNNTIVSLEAGNFDKFSATDNLKRIDKQSILPGAQLFEKAIAGKYLALYFNEKAKELSLKAKVLQTSQELSELSTHPSLELESKLARAILERAAALCATAISAIYEFCDKPYPFTLIGEGSMLWHGWHFPQNIEKYLELMDTPKDAIVIKEIKDSGINGAITLITGYTN